MDMIEKVARAICLAELPTDEKWELCIPAAEAAIMAMREPTEEVAREAFNHVATDDWLDFLRGHRAMIDAALKPLPL